MQQSTLIPLGGVLQREVNKFLAVSRRRSEHDLYLGRRSSRRYYRNWPLLISRIGRREVRDVSAALHNASESGLAFRSALSFPEGATLAAKLFWHDPRAYRVPMIVRHCENVSNGFIVGCEFALDDEELCQSACELEPAWYDRG